MSVRFTLNQDKNLASCFIVKTNNRKRHEIASASILNRP